MESVTRLTAMFLLWVFVLCASGAPVYLHELSHEREHEAARQAAKQAAEQAGREAGDRQDSSPVPDSDDHDTPCLLCAQLHSPLFMEPPYVMLLQATGWVPYISMLAIDQQSQTWPARILCRGPPSCAPAANLPA